LHNIINDGNRRVHLTTTVPLFFRAMVNSEDVETLEEAALRAAAEEAELRAAELYAQNVHWGEVEEVANLAFTEACAGIVPQFEHLTGWAKLERAAQFYEAALKIKNIPFNVDADPSYVGRLVRVLLHGLWVHGAAVKVDTKWRVEEGTDGVESNYEREIGRYLLIIGHFFDEAAAKAALRAVFAREDNGENVDGLVR